MGLGRTFLLGWEPLSGHRAKHFHVAAEANGITSLEWNLQWLRFALQVKNRLLPQVHRSPGSSSSAHTLFWRPGLRIAPCTLSLWPR